MIETLKFPSGEFTHTELAAFNGKTNQQVWVRYQAAIKDGTIVFIGNRPSSGGRGKPSKLFKVNDGKPVAITPVVPTVKVVKVKPVKVKPVKTVKETKVVSVESLIPSVAPATAPKVETVEVARVEVEEENEISNPIIPVSVNARLTQVCPVCQKSLCALNDASGVMVWCGQPPEVCPASEAPAGHGRNVATAYEKLMDKWAPLVKTINDVGSVLKA